MFVQCTTCLHAFDAASPNVPCPRCGAAPGGAPAGGPVPKTVAMDASMVAQAMRSSLPAGAQGPFAPVASPNVPQPFAQPPSPMIPPTSQGQFAGSFGPPQPYAPPARATDRDLAGHAILSVVLSAVAFLGACNVVGLAGVVLGLMAHSDANNALPSAPQRAKTARVVAVAAVILTALAWAVGAAALLFSGDAGQ